MIKSFDKLGLDTKLIEGLKKQGIETPTDIQIESIPVALENKDIIGQSQTGSGKTLAYLLPIFKKIHSDKREMQCIILAPTHELVMQITNEIKNLSTNSEIPVTCTSIIGDVNIKRQVEKLKEKPHIIVGSPGRILQLIKMKKISAHTVKTIVVDEGDRLLNKDNLSVVKDIIKTTMRDRQLMVFSATMNKEIVDKAKDLMKEYKFISIEEKNIVNSNIEHMYFVSEQRDKIEVLRKLIASINPKKAIIFLNKKEEIELLTYKLKYHHINCYSIFGKAQKEERKKALDQFRNGKLQFLIASDIAARGLDIKDVTHIFNLDIPENPKEYVHRVGRTGRGNNKGTAISIVTEKEVSLIKKYEKNLNIKINSKKIFKGLIHNC